ncbi:MAG: hypothetical protein M5E90_03515, partial [Asgard group archaeon]|nr:hypothetical protein [Asgard group archaeon]
MTDIQLLNLKQEAEMRAMIKQYILKSKIYNQLRLLRRLVFLVFFFVLGGNGKFSTARESKRQRERER